MSEAPPDLSTPAGLAAFRQEMRRVARPARLGGFALILAGCAVLIAPNLFQSAPPSWAVTVGYALIAVGWLVFLVAIFLRTRHHRRRLAAAKASGNA